MERGSWFVRSQLLISDSTAFSHQGMIGAGRRGQGQTILLDRRALGGLVTLGCRCDQRFGEFDAQAAPGGLAAGSIGHGGELRRARLGVALAFGRRREQGVQTC